MTDLLEDIEAYFIGQNLVDTGSIFRDTAPDNPDQLVAIFEYMGSTPFPQIIGSTRPVQITARSKSATTAKLLARSLYHALVTEDGILQLSVGRVCLVSLQQPPFKIRVDKNERVIYGFNVVFTTTID